jgi:hypothetical protein
MIIHGESPDLYKILYIYIYIFIYFLGMVTFYQTTELIR